MIPLACGIHEARRRIPCPVCPRVAREIADEPAEIRRFVVGSTSETDAPPRGGALSNARRLAPKRPPRKCRDGVDRRKRLTEEQKSEIARRHRRGESVPAICAALGVTDRTVKLWRNRR